MLLCYLLTKGTKTQDKRPPTFVEFLLHARYTCVKPGLQWAFNKMFVEEMTVSSIFIESGLKHISGEEIKASLNQDYKVQWRTNKSSRSLGDFNLRSHSKQQSWGLNPGLLTLIYIWHCFTNHPEISWLKTIHYFSQFCVMWGLNQVVLLLALSGVAHVATVRWWGGWNTHNGFTHVCLLDRDSWKAGLPWAAGKPGPFHEVSGPFPLYAVSPAKQLNF